MTTAKRPGNMETVYENRKTLEYGKIISYEDKYGTLMIELSDGKTKSMTYGTFKSAWRKKAIVEEVAAPVEIVEETPVETVETVEEPEIIETVEETNVEEAAPVVEDQPTEKPVKKRGALITFNGKSQNICAWGKELGISPNTLYGRIYHRGWSVEKAFTTKKNK